MSLDRHDTRARLLSFEGDRQKLLLPHFLSLYIDIAWKSRRHRNSVSLRSSSCKKIAGRSSSAAVNTASFCGSYSQAAAFLGSGHEFRSAATTSQTARRS